MVVMLTFTLHCLAAWAWSVPNLSQCEWQAKSLARANAWDQGPGQIWSELISSVDAGYKLHVARAKCGLRICNARLLNWDLVTYDVQKRNL